MHSYQPAHGFVDLFFFSPGLGFFSGALEEMAEAGGWRLKLEIKIWGCHFATAETENVEWCGWDGYSIQVTCTFPLHRKWQNSAATTSSRMKVMFQSPRPCWFRNILWSLCYRDGDTIRHWLIEPFVSTSVPESLLFLVSGDWRFMIFVYGMRLRDTVFCRFSSMGLIPIYSNSGDPGADGKLLSLDEMQASDWATGGIAVGSRWQWKNLKHVLKCGIFFMIVPDLPCWWWTSVRMRPFLKTFLIFC